MSYRIRTRRPRYPAVSASALVLAAAHMAVAQSTTFVLGTPSTTPAPANPYSGSQTFPTTVAPLLPGSTTVLLNGVTPNGGFVVTDTEANNGMAIAYKLQLAYSPADQLVAVAGPTGGPFQASSGLVSQTFDWANQGGSVTGQAVRYVPGSVAQAGYDAYLYIPSVFASTSQVVIVGDQVGLAGVAPNNTPNNTVYYGYNTSSPANVPYTFRQVQPDISTTPVAITSTPGGLNENNQLLVQAARFTGTSTYSTGLGIDVFLFSPAGDGSASGAVTKIGLTGPNYGYYNSNAIGSLVTAVGAANATAYQSSTSTPIAINAGGAAIGTTNRTQVNTPATASTLTNLGTDGWLYSGATALGATGGTAPIGTVQVGLAGTGGAALGGYYSVQCPAGISQTSTVNGISSAGAVTGTTTVYPSNTATINNPGTAVGVEAWQFKPTLVGGPGLTAATATGYGTTAAGTYVQLGLTAAPTGTTVGYVGTGGLRNTTVVAANAAANVVGTSQRYFAGATTGSGVDPWYYNGTTTSLISPTTTAVTSAYSNYVSGTGYSFATVNTTISAAGLVAGTQQRWAPGTTTAEGYDGWAYSPATNTTYVISSPAILANDPDFASAAALGTSSEYFLTTIASVSDTGLVTGEFDAFSGNAYDPNATLGTYVFAWTRQAGTVILGSDSTVRGMFPAVTLNSDSGSDDIDAYLGRYIYADAAGDIFGVGFATNGPTSTTEQVYVFAASTAITINASQIYHFPAGTTSGITQTKIGGLTIHATGVGIVDPAANQSNRQVLVISGTGLTIDGSAGAWTGKLDLNNNDMDLTTGSLATVIDQIRQGFANGTWAGTGGITSGSAAADSRHLTALGVIQNNQDGSPLFTAANPFDGVTPGVGDILVKYTYYGDANLDGKVDGSDYSYIDNGYLTHASGWLNGDFNYDGVIDGSDYTLIDNAFNNQGASLASPIGSPTAIIASPIGEATVAPVPEPAAALLISTASILGLRRPRFGRRIENY